MPDIFISQNSSSKTQPKKKKPFVEKGVKKNIKKIHPKKKKKGNIASYLRRPKNVDFEIKEKEEKVELLLRMHPITNLKWIFIFTCMLFAPIVLNQFPIFDFLPDNYRFIAILGWYLIAFSYALENFLIWYFNVYIITDERIVDIDFVNLIYKEITDADIDRIQDVTYRMSGVARTIFNYGDVYIQTASEVPRFEFEAVPSPDKVARILQKLRIQEKQEAIEGRVR